VYLGRRTLTKMGEHGHEHDKDLEKGPHDSETTVTSHGIHGIHGVHGHTGKRLRHFLRPDGRKVHIAATPDEVEKLKKRLSVSDPTLTGDGGFDVVIHGSLDHVGFLIPSIFLVDRGRGRVEMMRRGREYI
jgi:hypothetical protein